MNRSIGGIPVSAIGLGEWPLSDVGRPGRQAALATIRAALEAGVTLIDTADAYCVDHTEFGHGEELVAEAVAGRDDVLIATKAGCTREHGAWGLDGSPEYLRRACDASLRRLGVEAIGLYQLHAPDPSVPLSESAGALGELVDAGKVRMVGMSNVDTGQIREAREVLGGRLVSVQNEFSPRVRSSRPELELCDELGLAFLPYSPLGGIGTASRIGGAFAEIAERHGVSPQRVCLAWELAQSPVVIPIPGSRRPSTIRDSAAAAHLRLTDEELTTLDKE
ncbi:aldo/keto reductase [Allokutzneria albata]|uniref:Predicted oxidoreductase n=1 Tax=Allokutzneria albata TaxID=211114 RepID=A0A1H0BFZ3_ALLAB|nr:aldo/keto reductase [Allokutzneria albata]SDN44542.1 Predicted oxidoreductase [Allokutzneria albata]